MADGKRRKKPDKPSYGLDAKEKINAYRSLYSVMNLAKEKDWDKEEGTCKEFKFPNPQVAQTFHGLWKTFFDGPVQLVHSEKALAKLIIHATNGMEWKKIIKKIIETDEYVAKKLPVQRTAEVPIPTGTTC